MLVFLVGYVEERLECYQSFIYLPLTTVTSAPLSFFPETVMSLHNLENRIHKFLRMTLKNFSLELGLVKLRKINFHVEQQTERLSTLKSILKTVGMFCKVSHKNECTLSAVNSKTVLHKYHFWLPKSTAKN